MAGLGASYGGSSSQSLSSNTSSSQSQAQRFGGINFGTLTSGAQSGDKTLLYIGAAVMAIVAVFMIAARRRT